MRKALLAAPVISAVAAPAASSAPRLTFHPCADAPERARCGTVRVPLDRAAPAERIRIQFERYRHRDRSRRRLGTIVAVEGSPDEPFTLANEYGSAFEAVVCMRCGGQADR
ncbi:MAG TPA: hypothetical protein VFM58_00180 [Solirubrobacteraceae bacterium]|nr:hypothetical protein [Solirubrobacteraceae bacterium]